ncbi:MAG: hypothetical protein K9L98_02555 [Candidatus Pacebacteria bacterium]|nr:hypothetical protein [Candidatus Paceibacterota bacterium]MCF7862867.1 hypothetical protein [Candidatus Paceibacterota bacterium]
MAFDIPPQNNEKIESENIIQKLELKTGEELSLLKQSSSGNSDLEVGYILQGKLKNNVRIGFPIEFDNGGNTSNIKSIKVENGKYVVQTLTSVYEIQNKTPEKELNNILKFESFETERGSVYKVLENGQVQRTKNILDNPDYLGDDKGEKKERDPSDVIVFYDSKKGSGWLDDFSATDSKTGKTIAQSIDIGVYKKIDERTYQLVKNNTQIDGPFIFLRVRKDDAFKLKESFDFNELINFQERTMKPENKGLGALIPSEGGNITNIPAIGLNTVDYRYGADGKISSMHNGNKITSIKERK